MGQRRADKLNWATILALTVQLAAGIYYAGQLVARLDSLEGRMIRIEHFVDRALIDYPRR